MDNRSIRGGSPTTDSKSLPWGQRQVTVDQGILWIFGLGWVAFFAHVIFTVSKGGV